MDRERKGLNLYRIHWVLGRIERRISIVLDYDEETAIENFIRLRGIYFKRYRIEAINRVPFKQGYLGDFYW